MKRLLKKLVKKKMIVVYVVLVLGWIYYASIQPSNNRNWSTDQALLPYADIHGDLVTIHNIRNFTYASTTSYTPGYYDATYNIKDLQQISFIDEPFSGFVGAAHTFLSFEFANNRFLSLSIEIRKEKGESFSAYKGLLKQYELMYVAADERDVIKLRTNYRKDKVFLYPMKATKEQAQKVFLSMIDRMNQLKDHPEFYNTITDNCTNNIAWHVNQIDPGKIPWSYTFVFPSNADKYAFKLGFIDTTETNFEKVRATHQINALAEQYANSPDFSLKIRGR